MRESIQAYKWIIGSMAGASVFALVVTLIVLPFVIVKLRPDYFATPRRRPGPMRERYPLLLALLAGLKNLVGALFVISGVVMLLTPGQGLLSILVGLTMVNYPGKFRFEQRIASSRHIWRAMNWIRSKGRAAPLIKFQ